MAAALVTAALHVAPAHAQSEVEQSLSGPSFAVPIPPPLPTERRGTSAAPVTIAADERRAPWIPPLPPIHPDAATRQTAGETVAGEDPGADETAVFTRRVTEPPPPPAIDTPAPPDDPSWVVHNRPDPVDPPFNPAGTVDDVAPLSRPEIVADRPSNPQGPTPGSAAADGSAPAASGAIVPAGDSSVVPWEGRQARILFEGADTAFAWEVQEMLERVAARLGRDRTLRLSVLSYAGGVPESAGQARLLSLTRALAVRDFMTDRGIRQARVSVRGLGNSAADGPPDRIDLLLGN